MLKIFCWQNPTEVIEGQVFTSVHRICFAIFLRLSHLGFIGFSFILALCFHRSKSVSGSQSAHLRSSWVAVAGNHLFCLLHCRFSGRHWVWVRRCNGRFDSGCEAGFGRRGAVRVGCCKVWIQAWRCLFERGECISMAATVSFVKRERGDSGEEEGGRE